MNPLYCCDGEVFETLALALDHANQVYMTQGIILGIQKVE